MQSSPISPSQPPQPPENVPPALTPQNQDVLARVATLNSLLQSLEQLLADIKALKQGGAQGGTPTIQGK